MKHTIKMKGWPGHDIRLEFEDAENIPGEYRDEITISINGKPHGAISFNALDRDVNRPSLKLKTALRMGMWTFWEEYALRSEKENPE